MTIIAVMQPYLFPYLGYYQLAHAVQDFVFLDDVNFIKRGWINRNRIFSKETDWQYFTVPLIHASQNRLINETEYLEKSKWLPKMLSQFQLVYAKAPYFKNTFPLIEEVLSGNYNSISEMACESIKSVLKKLQLNRNFQLSSSQKILNFSGQERILEICKRKKASQYINPIGGTELYLPQKFLEESIKFNFLKMNLISYPQIERTSKESLSIIDVLMFNHPEQIVSMLEEYTLI